MSTQTNQIPDKVVSLFHPVVIDTISGRFAVFGDAGWFPVDKKFTQKDAMKHWVPWTLNQPDTQTNQTTSVGFDIDRRWETPNSRNTGTYAVTYKAATKSWACSCKGWIYHQNADCKHIKKIKAQEGVK